jgi:hypothetical protein
MSNEEVKPWRRSYYHGTVVKSIAEFQKREPRLVHLWIKRFWNVETTTKSDDFLRDLIKKIRAYMLDTHKFVVPLPKEKDESLIASMPPVSEDEENIDISFNF